MTVRHKHRIHYSHTSIENSACMWCLMSLSITDSLSLPSSPPDCKLISRERAKLCFRAIRCKPHQGTSYRKSKLCQSALIIITVLSKHRFVFGCILSIISSYFGRHTEIHLCRPESGKWTGKLKTECCCQFNLTNAHSHFDTFEELNEKKTLSDPLELSDQM